MASCKENEAALEARIDGNALFKQGRFFEALLKYNQCLCHAEADSEGKEGSLQDKTTTFQHSISQSWASLMQIDQQCTLKRSYSTTA